MNKPKTFKLFIVCLLLANRNDVSFQGQIIKRGQFIASLDTLSRDAKMSVQEIRTSLKNLKKTGEISVKSTNKNSIITICNYDSYQSEDCVMQQTNNKQTNKQITNKLTTNNNKTSIYIDTTVSSDNKLSSETSVSCATRSCTPESTLELEVERPVEKSDVEKVVDCWNVVFSGTQVPSVRSVSKGRRDKVKARIKEYGLDVILSAIHVARGSKFLTGESGRWKMTFDWMFVNDGNLNKILEGNYNDSGSPAPKFDVSAVNDISMLSDSLLKMIDEEYSLQGEDGEWYSCLEDLKRKKNSKSERIKREVERKKSMQ